MHQAGWGVEVISWRTHCKRGLREWATTNGVFVPLDEYYDQVTFLEGGRFSNTLNLSNRVVARPQISREKMAEEKAKLEAQLQIQSLQRQLQEFQEIAASKAAKKVKYDKAFKRGRR